MKQQTMDSQNITALWFRKDLQSSWKWLVFFSSYFLNHSSFTRPFLLFTYIFSLSSLYFPSFLFIFFTQLFLHLLLTNYNWKCNLFQALKVALSLQAYHTWVTYGYDDDYGDDTWKWIHSPLNGRGERRELCVDRVVTSLHDLLDDHRVILFQFDWIVRSSWKLSRFVPVSLFHCFLV